MSQPFHVVDAFTDRPFAGNPAAVCVMPAGAREDEAWMRLCAREMNLSETAFVFPISPDEAQGEAQHEAHDDGADAYKLRWFTPAVEVELCGHATIASAHVLWQTGRAAPDRRLRFLTKSGWLGARRADGGVIDLDFPTRLSEPAAPLPGLERIIGAPIRSLVRHNQDYLAELADESTVRALTPDHTALARAPLRMLTVTARASAPGAGSAHASSDSDAPDFVSRVFAPGSGISEDPVTGSAHCALAPYWAERLGKPDLVGHQASARGGTVRVRLRGERVWLGGRAVTISRGETLSAQDLAHLLSDPLAHLGGKTEGR